MNRWTKIIILTFFALAACGGTPPQPVARETVPLTDVSHMENEFAGLARAQVDFWNSQDQKAAHTLFTEDASFLDWTFGDHVEGPDAIYGIVAAVAASDPDWHSSAREWFVGRQDGIAVSDMWNVNLGYGMYTREHPLVEVDWLHLRAGQIYSWRIMYGFDSLDKSNFMLTSRADEIRALLTSYQTAWSSGDPQQVADLYASDGVRQEPLLGVKQEGREAILSYAKSFFAWYPSVQWEFTQPFGEVAPKTPLSGGIFTIHALGSDGKPCDVRAAVLLQDTAGKINHEYVYYDTHSLIKCGWAW